MRNIFLKSMAKIFIKTKRWPTVARYATKAVEPLHYLYMKSFHNMDLKSAVCVLVSQIPKGKVLGYGHVAILIGRPNHARHVGFALSALPSNTTIPWWRVIRSDGSIALQGDIIRGPLQIRKLRAEKVVFKGNKVDMNKSKWDAQIW